MPKYNQLHIFFNDYIFKFNLVNHIFASPTIGMPKNTVPMIYFGLLLQSEIKKMPIFKIIFHLNNSAFSRLQMKIIHFL